MNNWKYYCPLNKNGFSWLILVLLVAGAVLLSCFDKDHLFWLLNQQHSFIGDIFFRYYTHVGDGLVMIAIGVVLLGLRKRKLGLMILISFLISGLIVQLSKRYKPEPRPGKYFTEINRIHSVHDQPLTGNNSFPSGHTTTAFALFSMLAFHSRKYSLQIFYFLAALLVGYSRIYLGQHFFKDVYAGALLGYGCSLVIFKQLREKDFGGY
jgi:membrane-associated phospholipid phosphatase